MTLFSTSAAILPALSTLIVSLCIKGGELHALNQQDEHRQFHIRTATPTLWIDIMMIVVRDRILPAFLVLALFGPVIACAQNSLSYQWDISHGGLGNEFLGGLIPTGDGGFLAAGNSNSPMSLDVTQPNFDGTNATMDVWLVKCDANGTIQWNKRFGGNADDFFADVIQTNDGGYAICFQTSSPVSGNITEGGFGGRDIYVMKLDATGSITWQRRLGGSANESAGSILETADGGFLVGGSSGSSVGGTITEASNGAYDFLLAKLDGSGAIVWDRLIGGPGEEGLRSISPTTGGYFLVGASWSDIGGDKTVANYVTGDSDFWIIKIDPVGAVIFDRVIGSLETDRVTKSIGYPDGGIVIGSSVWAAAGADKSENTWGATDGWIIRLDDQANILWDHSIGGDSHEDDFGNLSLTASGNIIASGTTYSASSGWKDGPTVGPENTWVVEIDPVGNEVWDKTVITGYAHSEVGFAIQLLDGCYVFADEGDALLGGDKTDPSYSFDFWTVKYCDVIAPPVADFDMEVAPGCTSAFVDFINSSTNTTSWTWIVEGATVADPNAQFLTDVVFTQEGDFLITLIACNGLVCDTMEQIITIAFGGSPSVDIGDQLVLCSGDVLILDTEISGAQYLWTLDGDTLSENGSAIPITETGEYAVTVTDTAGCMGQDTVIVFAIEEALSLGDDILLCNGATATLTVSVSGGAFQWYQNGAFVGTNSPSLSVSEAGTYWVQHTYECGVNGDTVLVSLQVCDTMTATANCPVRMPNVFSPNSDGINDVFAPDIAAGCAEVIRSSIYDRWGLLLFEGSDGQRTWDGRTQAVGFQSTGTAPDGVYYYLCHVRHPDGNEEILKGHLTLLR